MTDTDLLFTPAVKAAALIRARKLSPVEYLDAVLKAAERGVTPERPRRPSSAARSSGRCTAFPSA